AVASGEQHPLRGTTQHLVLRWTGQIRCGSWGRLRATRSLLLRRRSSPNVRWHPSGLENPSDTPLRGCRTITFTITNISATCREAAVNSSILDFDGVAEGSVASSARQ